MIQLKYFPGNTLLHRLDPRTKLFLVVLFIFIEVAFRDIRIILIPFAVSLILYFSAKIPFKEVKSTWRFLIVIIVVISGVNTLFTFVGTSVANPHVLASYWIFTVTSDGLSLALAAAMRLLSLAIVSITVLVTTDPGLYGSSLAKLKIPYKGAYVFDLAIRYLPAYAEDLETTMNAQAARGFKPKGGKGFIGRIINTVPLLVPVSINAMLSIYDIADAMELRAFGSKKQRTWYRETVFSRIDYFAISLIVLFLGLSIYLRILFPGYWVPT